MVEHPRISASAEHLPDLLSDEHWCTAYLFQTRWPHGFTCPCCSRKTQELKPRRRVVCPACGYTTSLTSGTVLHGTKKSLSEWLRIIWLVSSDDSPVCISRLRRNLPPASYQTTWSWIRKLRSVIAAANLQQCTGTVEVAAAPVRLAGMADRPHYLLAALEVNLKNEAQGRVRLGQGALLSATTLSRFFNRTVAPGSTILMPDCEPFATVSATELVCLPQPPERLPGKATAMLQRFIRRYCRRPPQVCSRRRLQTNLQEFCFNTNKRLLPDQAAAFQELVHSALHGRSRPAAAANTGGSS